MLDWKIRSRKFLRKENKETERKMKDVDNQPEDPVIKNPGKK